ncbi:hypothetical protein [Microbulbifer sp. TYP-18]|uniref:hypothetical protein n=1 Tax=Microbulbifer sp. TYP-18 TaxID=3230024 RepID=UPI0034C6BF52
MADSVVLGDKATQSGFARLVGTSQPAINKHVEAGVLVRGASYEAWLLAYCERLRIEAAGRRPSNSRERKDMAQAQEAEVNAQLKMRELYREDQLILDTESVRKAMLEWASVGKNEFLGAVDGIVTAIESQYAITIERESLQPNIDAALRAIGDYGFEPAAAGTGDSGNLDTTT